MPKNDMVFVVTENCIKCKFTECVEICPVDCFYEGENMLVINPEECIGCGVCEAACPSSAIIVENDKHAPSKWLDFNRTYSAKWPLITSKKDALPEAEEYKGIPNKLGYFSENPGVGN